MTGTIEWIPECYVDEMSPAASSAPHGAEQWKSSLYALEAA